MFCKKGVLRNFAKFTGKHQCRSLRDQQFYFKKRFWHRCFPVHFAKFLRTLLLQNISGGCFCYLYEFTWNSDIGSTKRQSFKGDICTAVSDIINILETVHYDLDELKRKSTKNFQGTETLREKCPKTELFRVRISLYSDWIRDSQNKSPYSVRIQENTDQK